MAALFRCVFQLRRMQEMLKSMQEQMARQSNSNLAAAGQNNNSPAKSSPAMNGRVAGPPPDLPTAPPR